MSKPIEPGCLALVTTANRMPEFSGRAVTVISRVPDDVARDIAEVLKTERDGYWEIDAGLPPPSELGWVCHERHLLRIDGDEHVSTEQREEVEA